MAFARNGIASSRGLVAAATGACTLWAVALFSVSAAQAPAAVAWPDGYVSSGRLARPAVDVVDGTAGRALCGGGPGGDAVRRARAVHRGVRRIRVRRSPRRLPVPRRDERIGRDSGREPSWSLSASADDGETAASKPVRLNRGANPLRVTYTSAKQGDSYLRLFWSSPEIAWEPVPASALTRAADDAPRSARRSSCAMAGRCSSEYRCLECHRPAAAQRPEAAIDAPAFTDIGARLNAPWMAQWVENPAALRPSARMPRLLHGAEAQPKRATSRRFSPSPRVPAVRRAARTDGTRRRVNRASRCCAARRVTSRAATAAGPGRFRSPASAPSLRLARSRRF